MVVSFKYFNSTQAEAYKPFFEVNGVQVVYLHQNDPRITHVIFTVINESFTAIVSGLCFKPLLCSSLHESQQNVDKIFRL